MGYFVINLFNFPMSLYYFITEKVIAPSTFPAFVKDCKLTILVYLMPLSVLLLLANLGKHYKCRNMSLHFKSFLKFPS